MKQLLLATATLVGMSSAVLAAEPVALTDSQLDNVTAGQPGAIPAFSVLPALPSLYVPGAFGMPVLGPVVPPTAAPFGLPAIPGI